MKPTLMAVLFATTAIPALAQNVASFAAGNCAGQTYSLNGLNGWNYGGTNDLSDGNDKFASHQASQPSEAAQANGTGLSVGVVRTGSGLRGTMLNTHRQWSQQYGYIEVVADVTREALQPGVTTSVWLMSELGGWPPETDVMETIGPDGDTAVHSRAGDFAQSLQPNLTPGRHVWAVDWTKDTMTFYFDGEIPKWTDGKPATAKTPYDFHVPMHLIVDALSNGPTGMVHIASIRAFKDMPSAVRCVPRVPTTVPSAPVYLSQNNPIPSQQRELADLQRQIDALPSVPTPVPPTTRAGSGIAAQRAQQRLGAMPNAQPAQADLQAAQRALQELQGQSAAAPTDPQALLQGAAKPGIGQGGWHSQ
jgi:Glycosyl hydrolases family 16